MSVLANAGRSKTWATVVKTGSTPVKAARLTVNTILSLQDLGWTMSFAQRFQEYVLPQSLHQQVAIVAIDSAARLGSSSIDLAPYFKLDWNVVVRRCQ